MTDWESMSFWQKFNDDDISRPEKSWKNRFFWTWPIHVLGGGRVTRDHRRFSFTTIQGTSNVIPCLKIKTTKFKGETYKNVPLSNTFMVAWYGWFWGWKS